jgi:hypothetical protein
MAIKNPERECKTTPQKFSTFSKIMRVEKEDCYRGIILDSLDELTQALLVYNGGSVPGAHATQNKFFQELEESKGPMAVGYALLASALLDSDSFVKQLIENITTELQTKSRFNESFDYTMNNFQKTIVQVERIQDKYILELWAAYVGNVPRDNLAKKLGKPLALANARAIGHLSIVDDWWFNVDLEDIVNKFPLSFKPSPEDFALYHVSGGYSGKPLKGEFQHNTDTFFISVGVDACTYLRPEGGTYKDNYLQARGKSLVGGAWASFDEHKKINPVPKEPSVVAYISLPGEKHAAVSPEEMRKLKDARDYIAELLSA